MRKILQIILVFCYTFLFSQEKKNAVPYEIFDAIIKKRARIEGSVEIIEKPVAKFIEHHLTKIIHTKDRVFQNVYEGKVATIQLTEKERDSIISSLRKELKHIWKAGDFQYPLADTNAEGYLVHKQNTRLLFTRPIFLRNNELAVVLFGNYIPKLKYAHSDLSIYKKINGVWTVWIPISSRTDVVK